MKWLVVGGAALVVAAIASQLNFGDGLVYFYVPSEVEAKAEELRGQKIKIGAMVKEGTVNWNPKQLQLDFMITDYNGHEFQVKHKGIKPDMFKESQGVVVEGRFDEQGVFLSHNLMVKHSEEYKKPDAAHSVDKELLKESIFK